MRIGTLLTVSVGSSQLIRSDSEHKAEESGRDGQISATRLWSCHYRAIAFVLVAAFRITAGYHRQHLWHTKECLIFVMSAIRIRA
jgi:hypothetical protein